MLFNIIQNENKKNRKKSKHTRRRRAATRNGDCEIKNLIRYRKIITESRYARTKREIVINTTGAVDGRVSKRQRIFARNPPRNGFQQALENYKCWTFRAYRTRRRAAALDRRERTADVVRKTHKFTYETCTTTTVRQRSLDWEPLECSSCTVRAGGRNARTSRAICLQPVSNATDDFAANRWWPPFSCREGTRRTER